ncbi:F-box protein [Quillaja saponaria]|uniref:F-box protein n=1 Tax=Quillaja saponaria TaxID=32244 RepID=A0AAD7PYL4_QUISA|nr:F-box protein [Quillaja saponaria]
MAFSSIPDSKTTSTTVCGGGATMFSDVHTDIIRTHILTRLNGPTLASAASTSSQLYALSSQEDLWANICRSTWPSTNTPRLRHVISTFSHGSRSFLSQSFPILLTTNLDPTTTNWKLNPNRIPQLISAIDIYYRGKVVFSKVVETETVSDWFNCSPFRVDLLDPKDVVPTPIKYPNGEYEWEELGEDLTLSWILIDPTGRRAVNLSSHKPVSVQRHWLSGEAQVRFASILTGDKGSASEFVQCGIVVTCGGLEEEEMQVREASLEMKNMDGTNLNGRDSVVILQRYLEGKTGRKTRREEEGRNRYQEYIEKRRERKERKLRAEGTLDMLCMILAVMSFAGFGLFVWWK